MVRGLLFFFVFGSLVLGLGVLVFSDKQTESIERGTIRQLQAGKTEREIVREKREIVIEHTPVQSPEIEAPAESKSAILENVPFTSQAPFGEWNDPIFQNACEEASLIMAAYWITGASMTKEGVRREILELSESEKEIFGHAIDTSIRDTESLFREFYGNIAPSEVREGITLNDIRGALVEGKLVIVPADGRRLKNPNYTQPGPPEHMVVVIGYDADTREFITHDPGTRNGSGYRYDENVFYNAISDYLTGRDHKRPAEESKAMMTVQKLN